MKKHLMLASVLVAALISSASAQLVMWTTEVQPSRMEKQAMIMANFEAETGISVELVPVEESSISERVTAAFAAGELPDVIAHPISQTIGWAAAGILDGEAASEVVENLGADTFAPGALAMSSYEDAIAAVPVSGWTQLLAYRADLFEEAGLAAPTSFESILAAVEALHNPPEMYGFVAATDPNQDYMMQVLEHFFLANGVSLLNDDGSAISLDEAKTIEVLNFYKALADASPEGNLYWAQSRELFLAGQAAMIVWSPFLLDELAGLRDSAPVTAYDDPTSPALANASGFVTSIAGPSNPDGAGWASISNFGITVDADTDNAMQLVEFMMSSGYLDWLSFAPEGLFPVRRGTADDASAFIDGWANLDVGVDRRAPLSQFYDADVISNIVEGLDVAERWAYSKGQGALISRLYGTRVMTEVIRRFLDDELSAEDAAAQLIARVTALQ